MTLSQSQLRFISSIGIGILVGTSLIVIIPEGIEAIAVTGVKAHSHSHAARSLVGGDSPAVPWVRIGVPADLPQFGDLDLGVPAVVARAEADPAKGAPAADKEEDHNHGGEHGKSGEQEHGDHDGADLPTFYIGFSLVLGFVLMFLIERLPRHATERFLAGPTTRHISLDNLLETSSLNGDANGSGSGGSSGSGNGADESDGFLSSLLMPPSPKQSRSLATTTGLVIHAAADGIAMGASATTSDMKLGLIIFVAIMIHKAPAAFGLTSVLLKQGLSKRAARGHLIIFSLAAPVGAISTWFIVTLLGGGNMDGEAGRWWTGMLLLFSAGTFLYASVSFDLLGCITN